MTDGKIIWLENIKGFLSRCKDTEWGVDDEYNYQNILRLIKKTPIPLDTPGAYQEFFDLFCSIEKPPTRSELDDIINLVIRHWQTHKWMPIETAPKSVDYYVVTDGKSAWCVQFDTATGDWWTFDGFSLVVNRGIEPTHWIPLPSGIIKKMDAMEIFRHETGDDDTVEALIDFKRLMEGKEYLVDFLANHAKTIRRALGDPTIVLEAENE